MRGGYGTTGDKAVVRAAPLYVRGAMACRQTCLSTISIRVRALCLNTMGGELPFMKDNQTAMAALALITNLLD